MDVQIVHEIKYGCVIKCTILKLYFAKVNCRQHLELLSEIVQQKTNLTWKWHTKFFPLQLVISVGLTTHPNDGTESSLRVL